MSTAFKQWQTHKKKVSLGNHSYNIVFEALFQWFSDALKSWLQQSKQTTDNVHLKHNLNNFQKAFTIVDKMLMTSNTATEVESEYLPVAQDDSSQLLLYIGMISGTRFFSFM